MENVSRGLPEGPGRRAARIARVGARYGFGFVFGGRFTPRRRRRDTRRVGARLRLSFEELGPTFAEFGLFLAARRDLVPPDVAEELESGPRPVFPIAFPEVREFVERGLGNDLEKLFVSLDETPVRTGPFTQSHAAVLPGDRPALVVVSRAGSRRDVLAMRPVADLARRRLGDRLPLDPSEAVAEFAVHAGHRRDMFSAAQLCRRLADVERFPLRVPAVYRDYSSARCITFEAPTARETPHPGLYAEVSDALVRLAMEEGIFFPDPTPERFSLAEGQLWLSDPTEVFALDAERLRGLAEVLAAVRRGDVDAVARAIPHSGGFLPRDPTDLRRELRETLGALGGPLWREHPLARIRDTSMEGLRRGHARVADEVAQMMRSLVAAEALGRLGDDRYNGISAAAESAQNLISRYRDPAYIAARTARRLAQPDAYAEYPRQVHALLDELKDGEVEVRFRHEGLDDLISKVDILANRLVFAFLIAALIVGSSMLGIFSKGGIRLLGVSVFGLAGFVVAAVLGLLLLIGIIRSGRL